MKTDAAPAVEWQTVASPDHASVLDAALDVDALDNMRDEDVTVDMLRACVKRLRSAEEKLAQVSNKRKGLALGEVTNTKFHKAGDEKQTTTVTTKRKQMIVKKVRPSDLPTVAFSEFGIGCWLYTS